MKKFLIITLLLAGYLYGSAQSELPKFAPNPDKVKVVLDMPLEGRRYKNGTGYSLNPRLLTEMPKKVALVSFYSFDPGMTKIQTWKPVVRVITQPPLPLTLKLPKDPQKADPVNWPWDTTCNPSMN